MSANLYVVNDDYFDDDFDDEFEENPGAEPAGGFTPLGFDKHFVVIFSRFQKKVVKLKSGDLKEVSLRLYLGSDWYDYMERVTKAAQPEAAQGRGKGSGASAVGKYIIQSCQAVGPYHEAAERRTGTWRDDHDNLLINSDVLWRHDGTVLEHGCFGRFVYPLGQKIGYGPETHAAGADEVQQVLSGFRSYNWQTPFGAELILGWIGVSLVASALRRRPHVLITGTRGSGKSTLLQQVTALLGPNAAPLTGCPTLIGLHQHVQDHPARGVVIDEFESDGRNPNRRGVFEAARASYSLQEGDAGLVRGSPTGEAKTYKMSSPFLGGGISIGPMEPADVSRWVILELGRYADAGAGTTASLTQYELKELGPRLARLFVSRWPVLRDSLQAFQSAVQSLGGDARAGDTYGTLMASHWTFVSDRAATLDDARRMVEDANIMARLKTQDVFDEQECLSALMTRVTTFALGAGSAKLAISEACRLVINDSLDRPAVEKRLAQLGLRLRVSKSSGRWHLLVANSENHAELRRLFAGSKWARGGWGVVLRRLPGGHESTQRIGRGLLPCKVTVFELPAELIHTTGARAP